ncbi:uncharacterized protein LOC121748370 [Salvia splendens]|uniref:uncharacterized protein LOC121748370 n=1 Tax=Salvia splendens TaxID=180675 RepID=UPI001C27B60D|nr:uncharacterized protein LOC121748370 [Salvia splendens]XP_041998615.1 uncharacterized protein LOC121748370 [Salvia splendens]XP_041998616.1 uncharacterized protein LOC121748370 [Salvia splendens]XP_041998617.1 uncharacterized protein LOC121748370 [Salvia splendens]
MHARSNKGFHSNCGESYDSKSSKVNIGLSPQMKQRTKLGSILNLEEYEDGLHPQVVKDVEKSKVHQKKHGETKLCKREEVVRYMSCLPSYLERGENPEKAFNIGVLDWSQLEKWQHNNADVFGINAKPSPSSSTSSSYIPSNVSSSRPSRDTTLSHHHRELIRPSSSTGVRSSGSELLAGRGGELPKRRNDSNDLLQLQQDLLQATQSSKQDSTNRQKDSRSLDLSLPKVTKIRSRPSETDSIISGSKGNGTLRKGEASKAKEQVPSSAISSVDFSGRCKTTVPKSTNDPGQRYFAACHQSDSSEGNRNRLLEENQFHAGPDAKVAHNDLRSKNNRFYSVFSEQGKTRDSQVEKSFTEVRPLNSLSGEEKTIPFTQSVSISPARRKNLEKKNSDSKPRNLAQVEILQMKVDGLESTKVRNPSPTRKFSFGISRVGRSSNSNSSDIPKQVINLPDSKATSTSACSDHSGEKSNANSRARSSPLRRLLEPLMKPKGVESCKFARSCERNPSARDRSLKSSGGQRESPSLLSVKETVDINCFSKDDRSRCTRTNGASPMQAFLQIAVTNGLPLFTFTVDNCRDILAAKVKELSSKENMCGWIYTFFSFRETKKKHAQWINQGSKDNNHGVVSNIVAQMKVSDIVDTDATGTRHDKSSGKEFVLLAVGSREADQMADCLPCDELAAIVLKNPERVCEQLTQSTGGLKEPFQRSIHRSNSGNESGSDGPFSTTVILPGGHHGVPSKGEPSTLIKRWKSGGSCDCGGWDLGCQLTVLAGRNKSSQRFSSIKSHHSSAVKLFSQEEGDRPMFTLSPFKEGIFSIEFDSSLKLVQAFSIAIAVVHSRGSVLLSSSVVGETENSVSKIMEVAAKYASNPPISPVARV